MRKVPGPASRPAVSPGPDITDSLSRYFLLPASVSAVYLSHLGILGFPPSSSKRHVRTRNFALLFVDLEQREQPGNIIAA